MSETSMLQCRFPNIKPRSSYNKGCKCRRCLDGLNKYTRLWYKNHSKEICISTKAYRKKNKKRMDYLYYVNGLKKRYGLSIKDYYTLFEKQMGCCGICFANQKTLKSKLCVDHCHKTSKIRGLICKNCNFGLGFFNDNIQILNQAIKYLESN